MTIRPLYSDETRQKKLAPLLERIPLQWGRYASIGDGWVNLVVALERDISAIAPDFVIAQVKEKFGGLRFYIESYGTENQYIVDAVKLLVSTAESESWKICESCGKTGGTVCTDSVPKDTMGWISTMCDPCRDEAEERQRLREIEHLKNARALDAKRLRTSRHTRLFRRQEMERRWEARRAAEAQAASENVVE